MSPPKSSEMRKALIGLVLAVVAVDVVALATFYLARIGTAPPRTKLAFTLVWMLVTLAALTVPLRRIRQLRYGR